MSGPIVRSGPSEKFTSNWDSVFGGGKKDAGSKKSVPAKKSAKKAAPAKAKKKK